MKKEAVQKLWVADEWAGDSQMTRKHRQNRRQADPCWWLTSLMISHSHPASKKGQSIPTVRL